MNTPIPQEIATKTSEFFFDCEVIFEHNNLSRSSLQQLKDKFGSIGEWEGCHSNFDCKDCFGAIGDVFLFQKKGKLWVRGEKYTKVLRNPENVYEFLNKSKKVKKITLVFKEFDKMS